MAIVSLATAVKLQIKDNGKVVKTFNVTYKEPSKKQQKQLGKENKEILDLFKKNQKFDRHINVLLSKQEVLAGMSKDKELLIVLEELEALYAKKDVLEESFEELGGFDKMLEASEETFKISVKGKDIKDLTAFIEDNGDYSEYLEAISEDAKEKKGN